MIGALIFGFVVAASWLLITVLQWSISLGRQRQLDADVEALRPLVARALQGDAPQTLYQRLIEALSRVAAAPQVIIFGFSRRRGWLIAAAASETHGRVTRSASKSLAAVAGTSLRCDFDQPTRHHDLNASEQVGLDELARAFAIDTLIPLAGRGATPLIVGAKLPQRRPARLHRLLDYFRLAGTAAVSVVASRAQQGKSSRLADQESIRALEESAFEDRDDGAASWLDWAVLSQSSDASQWFWSRYTPTDGRVLFVFGQLAASKVAASLLLMSIKSYCDELVAQSPADIEPDRLLSCLNRFLWRPTQPIGMSCHVLAIDAAPAGFAIASAGGGIVARLGEGVAGEHSAQSPLLGSSAFYQPVTHVDTMAGGEWVVVWSPGMTESAPRSLPWAEVELPQSEVGAQATLDAIAGRLPIAGGLFVGRIR